MSSNVPNINLGAASPLDPNPNSDFSQDRVLGVSQSSEQMMTGNRVEVDAMPFFPATPEMACFEMYPMSSQAHHQDSPTAAIASAPVYSSEPSLCKHISASEPSLLSVGRRSNASFCAKPNHAGLSRHTSGTDTSGGSSAALSQCRQSQSSLDRLSPIYEVVSNLNLFGEVGDREQYYAESESETGGLAESMTESDEQGGARGGRTRGREAGAHAQGHQGRRRDREGARGNQHRKHKKKTRHIEQQHSYSGKKDKKTNRVAARRLYVELKASSDESSSSDSDLGQVVTHSYHHHEKAAVQNQSVNWGSKGFKKPPPYKETEDKFSDPEEPSTSTSRRKKKKKSKCCGKISTRKKTAGFLAGLVVGIGATTAFIRSGGAGATAVAGFFGFAGAVNSGSTVEGNNNTVVGSGSNGLVNWNEMYVPPDPALLESLIERNQIKCLQAGMVLKDPSDNSWWGWSLRAKSPVCLTNLPGEMYQGACRLVGKFLKERERLDSSAAPPMAVPKLEPQVGEPPATESASTSSGVTGASSTRASSTTGISFVSQQRDTSQASTSGANPLQFANSGESAPTTSAGDQVSTRTLLDTIRGSAANQADTTRGQEWLSKSTKASKKAGKGGKAKKKTKS